MRINKKALSKSALSGSIVVLLIWLLMGTTTTVTWFTDTDDAVNSFVYGNVDLEVSYWDNGSADWEDMSGSTKLFDDNALYEPGYTQVVRLRIRNMGDTAFDYRLAVNVNSCTEAENYYGSKFYLADYLRFGVVFAETENRLNEKIASRTLARQIASNEMGLYKLNSYAAVNSDTDRKSGTLDPGKEEYAALVVTMPTDVGNKANYRGSVVPQVELGITVLASQLNTIQNIQ